MAGKVMKFSDKVKKIVRTGEVNFVTDEGDVIEFKVRSRSSDQIDELGRKYDAMKPPVPVKKLPSKNGVKIVENPSDPTYAEEVAKVQKLHFAHLALLFLDDSEKPEGTEEEQLKEIIEVELAGFTSKIVNKGFEISGLLNKDDEEEMEEVKND